MTGEPMTRRWTESCSPIAATQRDVDKAGAINALLVRPINVLPQKAGDPIRPFARGIFENIRPLLKPEVGVTKLRRATAVYVRLKRYYFASAQPDAMRHDLEGAVVEAVSEADRLEAQRRFLEMKQGGLAVEKTPDPEPPQPTKNELIRAALLKRRSSPSK